jgi:hypothetical protein
MILGLTEAAQDISFPAMAQRQQAVTDVVLRDPDVASVGSNIGPGGPTSTLNQGRMFIALKPRDQRKADAMQIIKRLTPQLAKVEGIRLYMQPAQDITIGGRLNKTQYQYTLTDADSNELNHWATIFIDKLKSLPQITDVATDQENAGPLLDVTVNREVASSFGILPSTVDNTLDDAFGQRIVSTMYTSLNQYHGVLEVDPRFQYSPEALKGIYVNSSSGQEVPLNTLVISAINLPRSSSIIRACSVRDPRSISPLARHSATPLRNPQVRAGGGKTSLAGDVVPGQRPGVPVIAGGRADFDRGGVDRHRHHPRRSLRKHDPSDHHSIHPAVCRHRCTSVADGRSSRHERDCHDRHHPSHRHREEERHHACRFRAPRRAQ